MSDPSWPQPGDPLPPHPQQAVVDFLAKRRSASAVILTEPGPTDAQLDQLLHLAVRVPDHGKLTPWRFILLRGEAKSAYAAKLEALAERRPDARSAAAKLVKLKTPPMAVAVVSRLHEGDIPEWEQRLSAAAVCLNLLYGATAMGLGANWITDWYAYDPQALAILGLAPEEKLAGFVYLGAASEPPLERPRPDPWALVSEWAP